MSEKQAMSAAKNLIRNAKIADKAVKSPRAIAALKPHERNAIVFLAQWSWEFAAYAINLKKGA